MATKLGLDGDARRLCCCSSGKTIWGATQVSLIGKTLISSVHPVIEKHKSQGERSSVNGKAPNFVPESSAAGYQVQTGWRLALLRMEN